MVVEVFARISIAAIAAVGAVLALAVAAATADVVDDQPAAISRVPGEVEVFVRGADGSPYVARHDGSWSTWTSLGGQISSGPAAASYDGSVSVFGRGLDGAIWQQPVAGNAPWLLLGSASTSAPGAVQLLGTDRLYVFHRGLEDALWYRSFTPAGGWSPWTSLGGEVTSAPAVISRAAGIIDVFARGVGGAVVQISWDHDHWTAWSDLGGNASAAPTATSQGVNNVELFARDPRGVIQQRTWKPGTWSPWAPIGPTAVDSGPAAAAEGAGAVDLFARTGNTVSINQLAGGRWSGWASLGPVAAAPQPGPVAPASCLDQPAVVANLRLSASFAPRHGVTVRGSGRQATVPFGHDALIRGRLQTSDGAPLPDAAVCVGVRGADAKAFDAGASLVSDDHGRFVYRVSQGPSRVVRFALLTAAGKVREKRLRLRVRPLLRLHATPGHLRNGQRVKLRGRVLGRPVPPGGLLVEMQAWRPDRWQTFETGSTDRHGNFSLTYRFTRTTSRQIYHLRARIPRQPSFPFASGASGPVLVEVQG